MSSPKRDLKALPPPPRVASSSRSPKQNEPHQSTLNMSGFRSAPPSGNFNPPSMTSGMMASGMTTGGSTALSSLEMAQEPTPPSTENVRAAPSSAGALPPPPKVGATVPSAPVTAPINSPPNVAKHSLATPSTPSPPKANVWPTPGNRLLARRQTHLPVLIVASEAAHQLAWKNQLGLTDLIQGLYNNMLVGYQNGHSPPHIAPFRSAGRFIHLTWSDLDVRFTDDFVTMNDSESAKLLSDEAMIHAKDGDLESEMCLLEDQIDNLLLDEKVHEDHTVSHEERQRQLDQIHKDAYDLTSPLSIPWIQRYRQALDDSTDYLPHELFHCPTMCLVVCTSQEETNPVETLKALSSSKFYLPHQLQNGSMDPNALEHQALVLHDNIQGSPDFNESLLASELRNEFGPSAAVLRVNSLSMETARQLATEENTDLWGGGGRLGNCLSVNDRASLRQYLATFVTDGLLPALERRIATLNAVVSERKKGVRNVFKSFWRTGKTKESEVTSSGGESKEKGDLALYRYDTIENQTRLLGDILFILSDYEAAYSNYRLIKDDFKQDKAHAHFASIQEMMALCLYYMDAYGRAREILSLVENALWSYSRAAEDERRSGGGGRITIAPPSTRQATRLCLVLIATQNIVTGRHLEVADLLASASSNETALGAAVLLEQGSAHYFQGQLFRKYAFHMLMSGHMFRSAEQHHHAFRCFTSALYIYRDGNWDELHNHLRSALAAQLFVMGRMAIALQLYGKLVGCIEGGRVSVKSQQKYISNLLSICNDQPKKALAGADRLAAPTYLEGSRRDAIRKQQLDRIVQVVRYTKSASRVLELSHVNLPIFDDDSVSILAEEASHHRQDNVDGLGDARSGYEEVWDELILSTTAELRAVAEDKASVDNEAISNAIKSIKDPEIRKVITEIDKEELSRNVRQRAKRSTSYEEQAPTRAQMEPYFVEFGIKNPMAIPIDMTDIQIVAKMKSNEVVCTNEDAVKITPLVSFNEKPKWTFHSTKEEFLIPEFCRVSPGGGESEKGSWQAAEEVSPFFVVSKTNLTLAPESRQTIALGICPLEQGDLEVLGVRYRLFDNVWLYHRFEIKGELLQNTRSNRANRVRGTPMLLKAKVSRGMPCLKAKLLPSPDQSPTGPALQGQIRPWILRMENIGTAAATNATLKTNVPWIRLIESEIKLTSAISQCLGPSGTLMRFPLKEGGLAPGDSIDVPIEVRTADSGKKGLYMLFRYELKGEDAMNNPPCRWLKKMLEVPAYPSVSMAASLVPSNRSTTDHFLSLEITNSRTDSPSDMSVVLHKLSLASWRYRVLPFDGQFDDDVTQLGWQERLAAHCKIVPVDDTKMASGDVRKLCSEVPLSAVPSSLLSSSDKDSDSILCFLCLERAHSVFQDTLTRHKAALARAQAAQNTSDQQPRSISQIRRANTQEPIQESGNDEQDDFIEATSVLKLCPRRSSLERIHLILSWQDQRGALRGSYYIPDMSVRPLDKMKGCPVTVSARHPSRVSHDFAKGPVTIPFTITLRNRLARSPVSFDFILDKPLSFDFSGSVRFHTELEGGAEREVPLHALVSSVGVYDLQHVRLVVVDQGGKDSVTHRVPLQWLITVTNDASN